MALERKKTLNVFKDARDAWGSYDDFPVGAKGTDPMPYLSRNRVPQPFFLVSAEDQVIIQMSGEGRIELQERAPDEVDTLSLGPGDTVYIPAGVPSRLVPHGENIQIRLKADPPGREAVAWYCARCGELVRAVELDDGVLQAQYWHAVQAFNGDAAARTCGACAEVHPAAELGDIAWLDVAAAILAED